MKAFLPAFIFFLYVVPVYSQDTVVPSVPFVKLKTGEIIYAQKLFVKDQIFGQTRIAVNDTVYKSSQIMFYRDAQSVLHGYINGGLRQACFEGRFNMFVIYGGYATTSGPGPGGLGFRATSSRSSNRYFYSIGLNPIKKVTVNNLWMDTHDNREAFAYASQAKRLRNLSLVSYSVALGSVGYILSGGLGASRIPKINYSIALGTMVVSTVTGALLNVIKWNKMINCVHTYTGYLMFR